MSIAYFVVGILSWLEYGIGETRESLKDDKGPTIPPSLAWVTMEMPSVFVALAFLWSTPSRLVNRRGAWHLGLFLLHYVQRSFVYPFTAMRAGTGRPMPLVIWLQAVFFCSLNGTMQSLDLLHLQ